MSQIPGSGGIINDPGATPPTANEFRSPSQIINYIYYYANMPNNALLNMYRMNMPMDFYLMKMNEFRFEINKENIRSVLSELPENTIKSLLNNDVARGVITKRSYNSKSQDLLTEEINKLINNGGSIEGLSVYINLFDEVTRTIESISLVGTINLNKLYPSDIETLLNTTYTHLTDDNKKEFIHTILYDIISRISVRVNFIPFNIIIRNPATIGIINQRGESRSHQEVPFNCLSIEPQYRYDNFNLNYKDVGEDNASKTTIYLNTNIDVSYVEVVFNEEESHYEVITNEENKTNFSKLKQIELSDTDEKSMYEFLYDLKGTYQNVYCLGHVKDDVAIDYNVDVIIKQDTSNCLCNIVLFKNIDKLLEDSDVYTGLLDKRIGPDGDFVIVCYEYSGSSTNTETDEAALAE